MSFDFKTILKSNRIVGGISTPDEDAELFDIDKAYHKWELETIYRELLHERSVISDCCMRFERTFKKQIELAGFYIAECR